MEIVPAAVTKITFPEIIKSIKNMRKNSKFFDEYLQTLSGKKYIATFSSLMRANRFIFETIINLTGKTTVIIPRYSCPSFAHGAISAGMKIRYIDNDPATLALTLNEDLNFDDELACIVSSNLFGLCSDLNMIDDWCRRNSVIHVVGADYGLYSKFENKILPKFGDVTIFNFQEGKLIPIGGAAVAYNLELFKVSDNVSGENKSLKENAFAIIRSLLFAMFSKPLTYGVFRRLIKFIKLPAKRFSMEDTIRNTKNEFDFQFHNEGNVYKSITNFQMSLGFVIISRIKNTLESHTRNALSIRGILEPYLGKIRIIEPLPGLTEINFIRYPIMVPSQVRQTLVDKAWKTGLEFSVMYDEHGMVINKENYPGAREIQINLITLPCNIYMTNKRISKLEKVFADVFDR